MARKKKKRLSDPLDAPVDSIELLWEWCRLGWKYRGLNSLPRAKRKEYGERVKYEMDLIISKDFVDYFLVLSDVVRAAKDRGVAVGPARGSAAASLVCYLTRITEVDPLQFPLMLFERFIDPNRHDLPDVDLDFEDERRDEVRQIMVDKYGDDRVGNIGTFTRYRGKNAIIDVARVFSIPPYEVARAKEFMLERSGGDSRFDASIMDTVEMFPEVKEVFDKYPDLYKSIELEGNYKAFGVHAAGLVIGAEPLWNYVATYSKSNVGKNHNTVKVLSVDKFDGEHLGLMKLDALGLSTMGMIARALRMVGMTLDDLYDIPLDDAETLQAFNDGDVIGIFQFEGRTMKMVCEELKPETFMDLAAVNALARPGPFHSGSTAEYIAIRRGQKEADVIHPIVSKICEATEGQIIYQEQILKITRDVGQFPWTHAAAIRKIISARKGESAFNAMWDEFKVGAASIDIDEHTAMEIWKRMATAGTYAFNIAHCVSYSMLGFWAMWLKVHYPLEFYAAQLHKAADEEKKVAIMRDMHSEKFGRMYDVLPPDPQESSETWVPVAGGVRAGWLQLPGVGELRAEDITALATSGELETWADLEKVKGLGVKTVEKVEEFCGLADPFGINEIRDQTNAIKAAIRSGALPGLPYPHNVSDEIPYEAKRWRGVLLARIRDLDLHDLFEDHRARVGEDLDPDTIKDPHLKESLNVYSEDVAGRLTIKLSRYDYQRFMADIWDAKTGHDYILADVFKWPNSGKNVTARRIWVIDPD